MIDLRDRLCADCGRPTRRPPRAEYCAECRDRREVEGKRELYRMLVAAGVCVGCKKEDATPVTVMCRPCLDRQHARDKKRAHLVGMPLGSRCCSRCKQPGHFRPRCPEPEEVAA